MHGTCHNTAQCSTSQEQWVSTALSSVLSQRRFNVWILLNYLFLQLLSNATAVKRLQKTVCQWLDLGLFHRQMCTLSLKYVRWVCVRIDKANSQLANDTNTILLRFSTQLMDAWLRDRRGKLRLSSPARTDSPASTEPSLSAQLVCLRQQAPALRSSLLQAINWLFTKNSFLEHTSEIKVFKNGFSANQSSKFIYYSIFNNTRTCSFWYSEG